MAHRSEQRGGYEIAWEEPPLTGAGYDINIASNDPDLQRKLEERCGQRGAHVISGERDLGVVLVRAREFVDSLLR